MKVVLISDTHSHHEKLGELPPGDLLIHAGDFTESRPPKPDEYKQFMDWFVGQPHKHKLLISGNRDQYMDTETCRKHEKTSGFWVAAIQQYVKEEPSVTYLEDQSHSVSLGETEIHVWGSPWTAIYGKPGKAFQIPKESLNSKWAKIPAHTDILVTHMPPYGVLDRNKGGARAGCRDLAGELQARLAPRLHVFGHIHESWGFHRSDRTLYVNAASKRPRSEEMNRSLVVEIHSDRNIPCTLLSH